MKKASYDRSEANASNDVEAPDVFPLEVPGLDVAAVHDGSTASEDEILPGELPDRAYLKEYKTKPPRGPSRKTDEQIELSHRPGVMPTSPAIATGTEAPNIMSIPHAVSSLHQPGAERVSGILPTTFSSHDIDGDDNLTREQQGETMQHFIATLVEPAPMVEVISDAELQAAYQLRCRKLPWRKLLWTGGLILTVVIIIVVTVTLIMHRDPDYSNQISAALDPFLPESSKEAIAIVNSPQHQAFKWLKTRDGVNLLSDERVRQLYALATFYHATNGIQWDHRNDLHSNNVTGFLPLDIGMLSKLTLVNLIGNAFIGTMALTGNIPFTLDQLTSLTSLQLSNNLLSGTIPSSLGQLTSLVTLKLDQNKLTGTIPSSLGLLTSLSGLSLEQNELTGEIPSSLDQLTSLTQFDLFSNTLSGTIPSVVCANLIQIAVDCSKIKCDCADICTCYLPTDSPTAAIIATEPPTVEPVAVETPVPTVATVEAPIASRVDAPMAAPVDAPVAAPT